MIETERLILRRWKEDDAEDLFRYASDKRVSEMALWTQHTSVEMSLMVIKEFFIPNPENFAVTDKESGEVIGCIGLVPAGEEHYNPEPGEREVGYWIGLPHWNKGLATEALLSLLEYCNRTLGLRSLLLTADIHNVASLRVAEKCGFIKIGKYYFNGTESLAYRLRFPEVQS